jgi:hypothetical protein
MIRDKNNKTVRVKTNQTVHLTGDRLATIPWTESVESSQEQRPYQKPAGLSGVNCASPAAQEVNMSTREIDKSNLSD